MYYYEVLVASQRYHADKPLTYTCDQPLSAGHVVIVPLQRQQVPAIVMAKVQKPSFVTKPVTRVVSPTVIPGPYLQLLTWLGDYYPAPSGQIVSLLLPQTLTAQSRVGPVESSAPQQKPGILPVLTSDQAKALKAIDSSAARSVLLHGDTGTGKTRVYLELIKTCLAAGKSALVLTPEIGLTPQLATTCQAAFPGKVLIMHSELAPAARRKVWLKALEAIDPLVVIGPRSALFVPLKNLGLIVIDESHEAAYKQEQAPHYLATRVGAKLADICNARLVLGTATPTMADYYTFKQKSLPIVRLKELAVVNPDIGSSAVSIIDLRDRTLFTQSPWISDPLLHEIEQSISKKQQSLIFLNRRGTARLILCTRCGWEATCPKCDLPLTYHQDKHKVQCHTCGYMASPPTQCPECSNINIEFRAIGTKALVSELERLLPQARIGRFDSDTAKSERLEHHYGAIRDGSVDILVGTQMLGKGLDLPHLNVLGIVVADSSLAFPDYTAEERTYQLISQALGRVHRGHLTGKAFIQTYRPDNPVLSAAVQKDYEQFYETQIAERQMFGFPPFRFLLKLSCQRASSPAAQKAAERLASTLRARKLQIEVIGPAPAFIEKTHGKYQWQLSVKAVRRTELIKIIRELPAQWSYDIDPMHLL